VIPLAERDRLPISQPTRLLMVAIGLVLVLGVAVAGARVGDDGKKPAASPPALVTQGGPSTTAAQVPDDTTTTTAVEPSSTSTTEAPTSGLGTGGSGSAGGNGLASTGGTPFAVPGALLLAAALVTRRLLSLR
jgi:hypothetical protein